ncbi:helix-turn-helix transcriptional regulator [Granulicella sp. WH15]|uniref:helix-turn-helix domain-containing protein n=1 Tax=Granulicella sp. WH15 TaxID=2602070 RepID=UPI001366B31F|nr:AraC family transcriptional regulator [Granulicella sp. WH15]QHN05133.1 helix-turn-helix transcriptional regulator [Granulicella sp. WH15]
MQLADAKYVYPIQPVVRTISTNRFHLSERMYPPNAMSPLHAHVKHYLIVTLDGQYASTFEDRTEEFKPWSVSYHRAGISHTSRYSSKGAKVLYVELPADQIKNFAREAPYSLSTVNLQGGLAKWTARQLYNEFDNPDDLSPVVLDSFILQLFAQVCRHRRQITQGQPAWLTKADELIRDRFMQPLSLAKVAKAVNVHPVHMAREFRRHYSCTVGDQIRRLRIEYACEQLSKTTQPLSNIALAAGFSDQSHFTVAFKQQVGTAPSRYRRALQVDVASSTKS